MHEYLIFESCYSPGRPQTQFFSHDGITGMCHTALTVVYFYFPMEGTFNISSVCFSFCKSVWRDGESHEEVNGGKV